MLHKIDADAYVISRSNRVEELRFSNGYVGRLARALRFVTDRDFDESFVKRDERGRFSEKSDAERIRNGESLVMPIEYGNATEILPNGSGETRGIRQTDSLENHMQNGRLSKERENLHRNIVNGIYEGVRKPNEGEPKTFVMLGGGSASGKSTVVRSGKAGIPDKGEMARVDSDEIKKQLPEYGEKVANGEGNKAASFCHSESKAVANRAVYAGIENGYNTLLDGTGGGNGDVYAVRKQINMAREHGYRCEGCYCTCSIETAMKRAKKREKETGRSVPDYVIENTHENVSYVFPRIASDFDHVTLFDTDREEPILIAECFHGKPITVHDEELYKKFLQKAY